MSKGLYCILSYWGHVLSYNAESKTPFFRPLLGASDNEICKLLTNRLLDGSENKALCRNALDGNAPDWAVELSSVEGCVSFLNGNKYIGSGREGQVFHADKSREWEAFLLVSLNDLQILRDIVLLHFQESEKPHSRGFKVGLRHFNLLWNQKEFPLYLNCPIYERYNGSSLRLDLSDGNSILLRKSPNNPESRPIIWIHPHGNIGNKALQYLTAEGIRQHVPYAEIQNIQLDMFGIDLPAPRPEAHACASTGANAYAIDVKGLGECLRTRQVEGIAVDSYTFNLEHYPSREACRLLLPTIPNTENVKGFSDGQIVCNIRGGEILTGIHGLYFPLPPRYYQLLQEKTGLELVFYGQIGSDDYSQNLRRCFPDSCFVESQGPGVDFETIRRSKNIAVSISTFSWLAAWLSHAERIFVPVGGMFNPLFEPGQTYLPVDDPAFQFVLLPRIFGVSLFDNAEEFWRVQARISNFARFGEPEEVRELLERASTLPRSKRATVGPFDKAFYQQDHPGVSFEVLGLEMSALGYYLQYGHVNHDHPVPFDEEFYREAYPEAELDIALGRFPNLFQHFLQKGHALGYRPRSRVKNQG